MLALSLGPPDPVPTVPFAGTAWGQTNFGVAPIAAPVVAQPVPTFALFPPVSAAVEDTAMQVVEPAPAVAKPTPIVTPFRSAVLAQPPQPPHPAATAAAVPPPTVEDPRCPRSPIVFTGLRSSYWAAQPTAPSGVTDAKIDPASISIAAEAVAQVEQSGPSGPEPVVSRDPPAQQQQQQVVAPALEENVPATPPAPAAQILLPPAAPTAPVASLPPSAAAPAVAEAAVDNSSEPPKKTALEAWYESLDVPARPVLKPKSRKSKLLRAQASAALAGTASVAPVAATTTNPTSSPPFRPSTPPPPPPPRSRSPSLVLSPSPAPAESTTAITSADKGKGKAPAAPEPEFEPEPWELEDDFFYDTVFEGDQLRSLCEKWIGACEVLMRTSPRCDGLANAWVDGWLARARKDLAAQLGPDADRREFAHEDAAAFVRGFFRGCLVDAPDAGARNAVLDYLSGIARKQDLDLGSMRFSA
ncbi:hypothetical protein VTK26DRAFT_2874 [Humicola hyalothermophila]